jgi:energy-coupling factor transporter ATP-binding protein EcfA2
MNDTMIDAILDKDRFATWIGLRTEISHACLASQLHEWKSNDSELSALRNKFKRFKDAMEKDPSFFPEAQKIFQEISEVEKTLTTLMKKDSKLEKESYSEILFFKPFLQPLNFIPFMLSFWATLRVYILPGLSLLIPILSLFAPYLILRFVFRIPMNVTNYMNILHAMLSGNFHEMMNPTAAKQTGGGSISPTNILKQFGVVMITFIQGIIQPYWTFKHLHSIDTIVRDHGHLILRFRELYQSLDSLLASHGFTFFKSPLPNMNGERDATARIILESNYFKMALKYVGNLEVLMCLANQKDVNPVRWIRSSAATDGSASPIFRITDTFDYQVPSETRKTISAQFDTKRHALLTGPNKGGKSTVLRALSISALLAHTYGCALGSLTSTPFQHIDVCLKPDDLPGSKSRFEREIEFTANTLTHDAPTLVFIDELYHSTNPPDALRSCEIYCEQLWKKPNVISVISTHLFELVEHADEAIQRICCPATVDKPGNVRFLYTLEKGICKVSSVDTLLQKNGLLKGGLLKGGLLTAPQTSSENLSVTTEC